MKEYNKSVKLEHVAYDIRGPVLEEAMRMRANGEKILRLNRYSLFVFRIFLRVRQGRNLVFT